MNNNSFASKMVAISAEARMRSASEMWRVRKNQPLLPRMGKSALGLMLQNEKLRSASAHYLARMVGNMAVLGHGSQQVVMADGSSRVAKLLINTMENSPSSVEATAQSLQEQSDVCQSYLGEHWLETTFQAVRLKDNRSAVLARQERLEDPKLYYSALDVVPSCETAQLAENISSLHADQGIYPDILGINNIASRKQTGRLCIIDTIPVDAVTQLIISNGEQHTVAQLTESRLDVWRAA